jgi:ubiquinone/menaquinone biosynthesis C-methylase UbiE
MRKNNKSTWESKNTIGFYEKRIGNSLFVSENVIFNQIGSLKDKKMLDIGIGTGRTTSLLHNRVAYYYGIDYSVNMVKACRKRFKTHQSFILEVGDATNLSRFMDDSFDIVLFSFNGIDYIINLTGRNTALMEIFRVLRPGGHFIFSSHNFYHISEYYKFPHIRLQYAFIKEMVKFLLIPMYNDKHQKLQHSDFTIFNDGALLFGLMTFYIKPEYQNNLLNKIGFVDLEVYDLGGERIRENYPQTKRDYFLYYSCTKK